MGETRTEAICFVLHQLQLLCGDYIQQQGVRYNKLMTLNLSLIAHQHLPLLPLSPDVSPSLLASPLALFQGNILMGVFLLHPSNIWITTSSLLLLLLFHHSLPVKAV